MHLYVISVTPPPQVDIVSSPSPSLAVHTDGISQQPAVCLLMNVRMLKDNIYRVCNLALSLRHLHFVCCGALCSVKLGRIIRNAP